MMNNYQLDSDTKARMLRDIQERDDADKQRRRDVKDTQMKGFFIRGLIPNLSSPKYEIRMIDGQEVRVMPSRVASTQPDYAKAQTTWQRRAEEVASMKRDRERLTSKIKESGTLLAFISSEEAKLDPNNPYDLQKSLLESERNNAEQERDSSVSEIERINLKLVSDECQPRPSNERILSKTVLMRDGARVALGQRIEGPISGILASVMNGRAK